MPEQDATYMARALQLAQHGLYTTDPNPRVGCVIVRDGNILAEGWHQRAGECHAEVQALAKLGGAAQGATAYVTLEPCNFQGKTGPCCNALINAGIVRVVAAMQDPNPLVAGAGFECMKKAGIEIKVGLMETQARALNPGFIRRMATGLPYVRIKLAMSVDGRTAMQSGESKWITGPAARSDVQRLRARSSVIITGIGTVLHDDPAMTVRSEQLNLDNAEDIANHQPLRVVLDTHFRTPASAKIVSGKNKTWVVGADKSPSKAIGNAQLKVMANTDGHVDLHAVLTELAAEGCNEILIEAGAVLSGAFLKARLVDELIIYMAPTLLGHTARPLMALPVLDQMADQIKLHIQDIRSVGDDWRISAIVSHKS